MRLNHQCHSLIVIGHTGQEENNFYLPLPCSYTADNIHVSSLTCTSGKCKKFQIAISEAKLPPRYMYDKLHVYGYN